MHTTNTLTWLANTCVLLERLVLARIRLIHRPQCREMRLREHGKTCDKFDPSVNIPYTQSGVQKRVGKMLIPAGSSLIQASESSPADSRFRVVLVLADIDQDEC